MAVSARVRVTKDTKKKKTTTTSSRGCNIVFPVLKCANSVVGKRVAKSVSHSHNSTSPSHAWSLDAPAPAACDFPFIYVFMIEDWIKKTIHVYCVYRSVRNRQNKSSASP